MGHRLSRATCTYTFPPPPLKYILVAGAMQLFEWVVVGGCACGCLAGPGLVLSFLAGAISCVFTGLAYSEFAARLPVAGSAYTVRVAGVAACQGCCCFQSCTCPPFPYM